MTSCNETENLKIDWFRSQDVFETLNIVSSGLPENLELWLLCNIMSMQKRALGSQASSLWNMLWSKMPLDQIRICYDIELELGLNVNFKTLLSYFNSMHE